MTQLFSSNEHGMLLFPSSLSNYRGKFLHLHATIDRNRGEAVAFTLLKQVFHCLSGPHHNACGRGGHLPRRL